MAPCWGSKSKDFLFLAGCEVYVPVRTSGNKAKELIICNTMAESVRNSSASLKSTAVQTRESIMRNNRPKRSLPSTKAKLQEENFVYQCEWGVCKQTMKSMKDFIYHVSFHISDYAQETFTPDVAKSSNVCFSCGWQECGAQILGCMVDFNRHVYFHVFHVRLKCMGTQLGQELKLGQCMLGTESRNWIPELPENLECSWSACGIIFDNPYIFYSHVTHHSELYPEGKSVQCKCLWSGCDTVVRSKHKLKEHLRSHTQEKIIACPTCGGLFCSRTKLSDHIRRQAQSDLLRYECSHCNRRFPTERMLREHMRRHVNHYKCPLCEMTCPTPSALRQHARYRHSEEKPFKCGHCEFSAKSSGDLRKHLDSHNVEDQFSCHIAECTFTARSYCSLALHFKKFHQQEEEGDPPRYKCHICDKTFVRGYPLTFHLKKKHMFQWPPGHSRFRYKLHSDGYFRLQTVRYESIDVNVNAEDENSSSTSSTANSDKSEVRKNRKDPIRLTDGKAKRREMSPLNADEPLNLTVSKTDKQSDDSHLQLEPLNLTLAPPRKRNVSEDASGKSNRKRQRKESVPRRKSKLSMPTIGLDPPSVYTDRADERYTLPDDAIQESAHNIPEDSTEDCSYSFMAVGQEEKSVKASRNGQSSYERVIAECRNDQSSHAAKEAGNDQPGYVIGADLRQRCQGIEIHVGEYGEAEDANLHMLGDVALTAPKDFTTLTSLDAL